MGNEILGIPLSNIGLRESLRKINEFSESNGLNTVAYISAGKLVLASDNREQRKWWSNLDLILYEDKEVLKAVGITAPARIREVEENKFLKEMLRNLVRGQREIFLLAQTWEEMEQLEEELRKIQSSLCIVAKAVVEDYLQRKESLINDINFQAPQIILSKLPYPEGIRMMYEYGNYLNASLWLGLPEKVNEEEKGGWLDKINKIMYKKLLNRMINHSKDTEKQ